MPNLLRKSLLITIRDVCDDCDDHLPPPPNHSSPLKTLIICILAAAFAFVCYIAIIKTCRRRRWRTRITSRRSLGNINRNETAHQDEEHEPVVFHPVWLINTIGLDQSVIDSIQIVKYKKVEGTESDCAVCLGVFEEEESLRRLPKCAHAFHVTCIDTWLRSHTNCPLCRAPVDPNSAEEETAQSQNTREENGDQEMDTNGESSEKKDFVSRVRVQSDLSDQCCRKQELLRRSISTGSVFFLHEESGGEELFSVRVIS